LSLHRIGPVRRDSKIAAQRPCWIPDAPGTPNDLSKSAEVRLSKSAFVPATYKNRTKSAESRGLEKDDRRERIFELGRLRAVQRFAREGPCLLGIFPPWRAGRGERDSNSRYGAALFHPLKLALASCAGSAAVCDRIAYTAGKRCWRTAGDRRCDCRCIH
jgi:hypothetical protein